MSAETLKSRRKLAERLYRAYSKGFDLSAGLKIKRTRNLDSHLSYIRDGWLAVAAEVQRLSRATAKRRK